MEIKENLEFCFKGSRNYIHGTDIYNKMIQVISNDLVDEKFDLSFHGIARNNISLSYIKPITESLIKFVCKYTNKNKERKVIYAIENNETIEYRYEYIEEDIQELSKLNLINQNVILNNTSSYSFIENTVALNKYLLENLFVNQKGKWYFTRLQLNKIPDTKIYPLRIELKANFNFKLTKSEVFIDGVSIGYIYFSLV